MSNSQVNTQKFQKVSLGHSLKNNYH